MLLIAAFLVRFSFDPTSAGKVAAARAETVMKRSALLLVALVVAVAAASARASGDQKPTMTLYMLAPYEGPSLQLLLPATNLNNLGFGGKAVSFTIESGRWQICTQPDFQGRCVTLGPGKYPPSYGGGFARLILSARPVTPAKPSP